MRSRKEELLDLKSQIEKLNRQLRYYKLLNIKVGAVKNLKISLKAMQMFLPYIIAPSILAGVFKFVGLGLPIYQDDLNRSLKQMKEIDNLGNVRIEQQYKNFLNSYNKIFYYGKWEKNSDGTYSRNIEQYRLRDITEKEILQLFQKKNISMKDIFGVPLSTDVETVNTLNDNLIREGYLQAIFYSENKNEFITVTESTSDNISVTILFAIITLFIELSLHSSIGRKTKYNIESFINDIDIDYWCDIKDTSVLEKKLNDFKMKYKSLNKDTRK